MRLIMERIIGWIETIGRAGPGSTGQTDAIARCRVREAAARGGGSVGWGTANMAPRLRVRAAVSAALFVALVLGAVGVAGSAAAAGTWPNSTSPTYTGPGSEPINESKCLPFDVCAFLTANGDSFQVVLPRGFVSKFSDGTQVNATDVIAAMLKLPAKYAPGGVDAVGGSISVAPSYVAKLATVGVTPAMLLGWLEQNVQSSQKAPWIPGSANAPASAAQPPANNPAQAAQQPAPKTGTTVEPATQHPAAAYPATPKASEVPAQPKPATSQQAGPASSTGSTAKPATSTSSRVVNPSAPASPGSVVSNPPSCPFGESQVVKPNGSVCMPDAPMHVRPSAVPRPWWQVHERELGIALVVLMAAIVVAVVVRRSRNPYRAYR